MFHLGINDRLILKPILHGLQSAEIDPSVKLISGTSEGNCAALLRGKFDAAFLSSLDYARHSGELKLIKDIGVHSPGASKHALLFFRENLRSFEQVGHFPGVSQYLSLAKLVVSEVYELQVDWLPLTEDTGLEDALDAHPVCFMDDERALENYHRSENCLDLTEEWYDKTGISYFHQLLAVREDADPGPLLEKLQLSRELGMRNLMNIARQYAEDKENTWDFYFDLLNESLVFFPSEDTWDSLREHFEYLFYYGMLDYLPEINFF